MESNVAELLEQQILSNRAVFPCGCVLECKIHYPHKDWVYTGRSIHICAEHPPKWAFVVGDFGAGEYRVSVPHFVGKFGKPYLVPEQTTDGPLERKWLKPDGTQLTLAELEQAMEENLDRLEREEEERCEKHNATRYRYEGITGSYGAQELLPKHISRIDPHIASREGRHAIGRFGTVASIPMRIKSMIHDEMELEASSIRSGDLVDLRRLQKEHAATKHFNFGSTYGLSMGALVPSTPNLNRATAQATLDWFNAMWPALAAAAKNAKPYQIDLTLARPVSRHLPAYAEADAKLTQQLWVDSEKKLEKDNLLLPYDTLPSTLSPTDSGGKKKE